MLVPSDGLRHCERVAPTEAHQFACRCNANLPRHYRARSTSLQRAGDQNSQILGDCGSQPKCWFLLMACGTAKELLQLKPISLHVVATRICHDITAREAHLYSELETKIVKYWAT